MNARQSDLLFDIQPKARKSDPQTSHDAAASMRETWRVIPFADSFSVSDLGRVRRDKRVGNFMPGLLKGRAPEGRYPKVQILTNDGVSQYFSVHALVLHVFVRPREPWEVCRHIDGDTTNNTLENLAYGSFADNARDAIRHGTQVRGSRQHFAKLDEDSARRMKIAYMGGKSYGALALEFGISKSSVHSALIGETWTHVEPKGDLRATRTKQQEGTQ